MLVYTVPEIQELKQLKQDFANFITSQTSLLKQNLNLNIIQIGDDFASTKYIQIKQKMAAGLGLQVKHHHFPEEVSILKVESLLFEIEKQSEGLIFQLPVPAKYQKLIDEISSGIDVDMLGNKAEVLWQTGYLPPTIQAIDLALKHLLIPSDFDRQFLESRLNFEGKKVAVIGTGKLVGGPMLKYLSSRNCEIISVNRETKEPQKLTQKADILVSAAGSPGLINRNWLDPKTIIIDAATSEDSGSLVGDVNPENVHESNILVPSPGGIGKLTVLSLFWNLIKLSQAKS